MKILSTCKSWQAYFMINTPMHHLAIIMDGNRRWAKERFMPAIFGHKAGYDNVRKITELAKNKNIKYLTLWALSTENLVKRWEEEIQGIIKLIHLIPTLIPEFMEKWVRFQTIWDIRKLPEPTQKLLEEAKLQTSRNDSIILTIALVYGGQNEILRATQKIIQDGLNPEMLDEKVFRSYLDTSIIPIPDVIVRTWGDIRHSGFLLYDSAYSEYYFTEKKWPEFDENELEKVIETYNNSQRNFWK